jgi:hypothetical protein
VVVKSLAWWLKGVGVPFAGKMAGKIGELVKAAESLQRHQNGQEFRIKSSTTYVGSPSMRKRIKFLALGSI